jgi:hypothetical protein
MYKILLFNGKLKNCKIHKKMRNMFFEPILPPSFDSLHARIKYSCEQKLPHQLKKHGTHGHCKWSFEP